MKKIIIVLISIFVLSGCNSNEVTQNNPISNNIFALGTICNIKIFDSTDTSIIDKAFDRIKEIENSVSSNIETSDIYKLNNGDSNQIISVSDDTIIISKKAYEFSHSIVNNSFDMTVLPLVELWGIGTEDNRIPSHKEIEMVLPLIDYKYVNINETENTMSTLKEGVGIDLGAIAKGYIADEVKKVLLNEGINSAIINLGGNVLTIGKKPNGSPFKIGVQDPYDVRGTYVGVLELVDQSIVTSGIYERYFEVDGVRYHHILDKKTGYPVENNLAAVSIISNLSIDGDALSTSVFTLGLEDGFNYIESQDKIDAIFITKDKKIYLTSGLISKFKLTNSLYTIQEK